ncbi:MAG: hypothetical protein PVJ49_15185 [Acidobacteriota bacterium]|jgi:hypothetical protein
MQTEETQVLTSWKEIASHLDVTVRTAQLWEKSRGLPVRRMPGPRGRVYMRVDECEAWLAGRLHSDDPRQVEGAGGEHVSAAASVIVLPWTLRMLALVVIAAMALGVWVGLLTVGRSGVEMGGSRTPTRAFVRADELIVENEAGEELWRKHFELGLHAPTYNAMAIRPSISDLHGDGNVEVLFPRRSPGSTVPDDLICYSAEGEKLWSFRPGGDVENDNQAFDNVYHVAYFEVVDLGEGRRGVITSNLHYISEPTQLAFLDADGRLISEYWHPGHIGQTEAALEVVDVDGDGRKEIYAAGTSNARRRAVLVILDPYTMGGTAEEPNGFQLKGLETGHEIARVFFPRSDMNLAGNQYNSGISVYPGASGVKVGTLELSGYPQQPALIYDLDVDLGLESIGLTDNFRKVHAELIAEGAIPDITLDEELARLTRQGIQISKPDPLAPTSDEDAH